MSANNWRKCPKCLRNADRRRAEAIAKAEKSYGQVPSETYRSRLEAANSIGTDLRETLREDWEIGVNSEGEFHCGYRASCSKCGLEFTFTDERTVSLD